MQNKYTKRSIPFVFFLKKIRIFALMKRKIYVASSWRNGYYPEVVANCNNPDEVIANCENPQETSLSQYDIEKLIVTVRGEQVLIDQDIARIYGVTTGRLNQQAKRNIARFPESFRFELTKEEVGEVVANCDPLQSLKFRPTFRSDRWWTAKN